MLGACRRVLLPGGRLAFLTIQPTPGLDPTRRRKAHWAGPPAVAVRTSYESLLQSAGFTDVVATDLTAEYAATQRRWMAAMDHHAAAVRDAVGDAAFDERAANRTITSDAISSGLLSRFRYTATRA